MVLHGPPRSSTRRAPRLELDLRHATCPVSTAVQVAAAERSSTEGARVRTAIAGRLARNLRDCARARGGARRARSSVSKGGWSAVMRVPAVGSEEALALELLEHDGVLVQPGFFFDFASEASSSSACCRHRRPSTRASIGSFARAAGHERRRCRLEVDACSSDRQRLPRGAARRLSCCRCSRRPARAAGASARSATCRRSARGCCEAGPRLPAAAAGQRDGRRPAFARIRRSARWRSTRSTSACRRCRRTSSRWAARTALTPDDARRLSAALRSAPRMDYNTVRALKMPAPCEAAFARFLRGRSGSATLARARSCCAVHRARGLVARRLRPVPRAARAPCGAALVEWDGALARRDPPARSTAARHALHRRLPVLRLPAVARRPAVARGAHRRPRRSGVFGDLPFMVGSDSADVWANQHAFRLDATVGTPPDAFSETGQDWGLPVYRWDVFEAEDDRWIKARAQRSAELFDGYRVDHLVGFYRTYVIPRTAPSAALLARRGARAARAGRAASCGLRGARRRASSPKTSGPYPTSCASRCSPWSIPGYKVLRWEREWDEPEQPFRDPADVSRRLGGDHRHARHRDPRRVVGAAPAEERQLVAAHPLPERPCPERRAAARATTRHATPCSSC